MSFSYSPARSTTCIDAATTNLVTNVTNVTNDDLLSMRQLDAFFAALALFVVGLLVLTVIISSHLDLHGETLHCAAKDETEAVVLTEEETDSDSESNISVTADADVEHDEHSVSASALACCGSNDDARMHADSTNANTTEEPEPTQEVGGRLVEQGHDDAGQKLRAQVEDERARAQILGLFLAIKYCRDRDNMDNEVKHSVAEVFDNYLETKYTSATSASTNSCVAAPSVLTNDDPDHENVDIDVDEYSAHALALPQACDIESAATVSIPRDLPCADIENKMADGFPALQPQQEDGVQHPNADPSGLVDAMVAASADDEIEVEIENVNDNDNENENENNIENEIEIENGITNEPSSLAAIIAAFRFIFTIICLSLQVLEAAIGLWMAYKLFALFFWIAMWLSAVATAVYDLSATIGAAILLLALVWVILTDVVTKTHAANYRLLRK